MLVGTGISAAFLLGIGLVNLIVLVELAGVFRRVTDGDAYGKQTLDEFHAGRGLLSIVGAAPSGSRSRLRRSAGSAVRADGRLGAVALCHRVLVVRPVYPGRVRTAAAQSLARAAARVLARAAAQSLARAAAQSLSGPLVQPFPSCAT